MKAALLRAATWTVSALVKIYLPTYYFDQLAALVANPGFLTSLPEDNLNTLKESFEDVKCELVEVLGHSTLIPKAGYEILLLARA